MQDTAEESWHVLTPELALDRLDCGADGLSTEEVHRRRDLYGPNELAAAKRQNPVLRFIRPGARPPGLGDVHERPRRQQQAGTLTSNEMTVQRVVCGGHEFDVGGVGYAPVGDITVDGRIIDPVRYPVLEATVRAGVLCNDSSLRQEDDAWMITGDPTEAALLVLGEKLGMPYARIESSWPRRASGPFESEIRMMGTLHSDGDEEPLVLVKGAPEQVIAICEHQRDPHGDHRLDPAYWQRMAAEIAAQGLRVLALAQRRGAPRRFLPVGAGRPRRRVRPVGSGGHHRPTAARGAHRGP